MTAKGDVLNLNSIPYCLIINIKEQDKYDLLVVKEISDWFYDEVDETFFAQMM